MQGESVFLPLEKVIFGASCLARLPAELDRLGSQRAMIITGRSLATQTALIQRVESLLGGRHLLTYTGIRQHVPESGIVEAVQLARQKKVNILVSVGGGSPIDSAKSIARRLHDEGIRMGSDLPYLPHIAIPTTLSAAEFSHVAGYTDEVKKSKAGITDPHITPRVVFLDPEMTLMTPMWLWLSSGIRSLDHAIETLYSPGDHPVNDLLALQAIRWLFEFLPRSKNEPNDIETRVQCQLAAWMSYFSPASVSAHLGLSHTIGKRVGATYDVPHGVTSCILLPHVIRHKAEQEGEASRLAPVATELKLAPEQASDRDKAQEVAGAVAGLVEQLELPSRLRQVNVPESALEDIARATSMEPSQQADVLAILREAW